ncbi:MULTISPECIES: hypothetical protein [Clostridium]|uniref:Uncharacterized protein n=1 Tax=Clostridium cibarium TaxID=2762247 RepID=A0ABR8PRV5_9CLOT|nr:MULTISPECIES: hypothetical protein [Clostridium]MBD7910901.1 hypothetical protein [Clostridium cibarium]
MVTQKMNLIYSVLKEEHFELSAASYEKDEYHIFYKSGLVLTIDLSTDIINATMMYFDINHEFVSYTYNLDNESSFDDLLEHVLNIISTNSMLLKWNLTLYELIHLDKLIFLSMKDLSLCKTNDNVSSIKIDRIMNFDKELFDMLLGPSNENNQITSLYNKLTHEKFKIIIIEKTNTGISNITRALFIRDGILITIFYEESGVVLCGDIFFQTNHKINDNIYIDNKDIVDSSNDNFILYKLRFSEKTFDHIVYLLDHTNIIYKKIHNKSYKKINLSSSVEHLTQKYHSRLDSISNELSYEDLEMLGM